MAKHKKSTKRPPQKQKAPAPDFGLDAAEQGQGSYMAVPTTSREQENPQGHDVHEVGPVTLDEDLYGFAAVALMRDTHFLAEPEVAGKQNIVRYVRLSISLILITFNTFLQVYLIYNVKKYITSATVLKVRAVYNTFESGMYDNTSLTVNGNARGTASSFHPNTFHDLDEAEKEGVCQIPLSQPHFLLVFIFLWSLTCLSDVKTGLAIAYKFFFTIPTVSSMRFSMHHVEDEPTQRVVVGITWGVRLVILFVAIIPRMLVGLTMTWLGCRWLIATNSFSDLFLNAVALAFVFDLKDILYNQLLPARNKRDVQNTLFPPATKTEESSLAAYAKGLLIGPLTVAWSLYYVYDMQSVLPDYGWDVHDVCKTWLIEHYAV